MATVTAAAPRTWRDEVTPVSRASRRRWALAYAALLVYVAVYFGRGEPDDGGATLILAVGLFVIFGMLRRSTRRLTALDHPDLDERDASARDRAFRLAYPLLLLVLLALVAVVVLALPDALGRNALENRRAVSIPGWLLTPQALLGLVLWVALWAAFLPTGVLAWLEPDALEPDAGEPRQGLSEAARDGLLAAAIVAGLILGPLDDSAALGLLPLMCALALLGRLARRGDPAAPERSTAERVLPLIGLALAVGFVAVLLLG